MDSVGFSWKSAFARNFSSSNAISSSCEKLIPSASIEFAGEEISSRVMMFVLLDPSQIPSLLLLYISNPEHSWNFVSKLKKFVADSIQKQRHLCHQHIGTV